MTDELEATLDDVQRTVGGGGGIIAMTAIEAGFKVFAAGVGQDDAWFPFAPKDQDAKARAQAQANALGQEHGGARVQFGINIIVPTENAYVFRRTERQWEHATWSIPRRHFFEAYWQDSCKLVVMPGLKANDIKTLPWEGWARLGRAPDPYGSTETNQDGEEVVRGVTYIMEIFANEADALAVMKSPVAEPIPGFETAPSGQTAEGLPLPDVWADNESTFRSAIVTQLGKESTTPESIAKMLGGITVQQVAEWATFYRNVRETADMALPLAATKLKVSEDVVAMWRGMLPSESELPY